MFINCNCRKSINTHLYVYIYICILKYTIINFSKFSTRVFVYSSVERFEDICDPLPSLVFVQDIGSVLQYCCNACNSPYLNPFPPSVPIWHRSTKFSILILEVIIKKISYERRDYESVDEKILS